MSFVLILYFNWLLGPHKGQNFEKKKKKKKKKKKNIQKSSPQKLSSGCILYFVYMFLVPDSSLYRICVFLFQSDKNSG